MFNEYTVFVDVDGVVADLESIWLAKYNKDYDDNLKPESLDGWSLHNKVKTECGAKIYDYLEDPTLYDAVLPVKHSLDGVNSLRAYGYRVVFATSSPNGSAGRKLRWLLDNGFLDRKEMRGTTHDDYIEIHDKSLLRGDVLIDDGPHNIQAFSQFGYSILFDRFHNRSWNWPVRASDWVGVLNLLAKEDIPNGTHITELKSPRQTRAFREVIENMYRVHLEKNYDYSPANILGTGEIGLMTRTWDKTSRLMNLMGFNIDVELKSFNGSKEPKNESIEDSVRDAAVYFVIWQLYRQGKWGR